MNYKYFHDLENQTVYRMPTRPNVRENRNSKKFTGWSIDVEILITRADNELINNRWKYPSSEYPNQYFDYRYTKEQALSYFYNRHTPKCKEIDESTYQLLKTKYEILAKNNKN